VAPVGIFWHSDGPRTVRYGNGCSGDPHDAPRASGPIRDRPRTSRAPDTDPAVPDVVPVRRSRRWTRLLVVAALAAVVVPVTAPRLTAQSLGEVEARVEQRQAELAGATQRFEDVRADVERTRDELAALEERAERLEREAAEADQALAERAREAFKLGGDPVLTSFLSSEGVEGAIERTQFLEVVSGRDRARLEQALALRSQLDQTEQLVTDRAQELEQLEGSLAEQREALDARLSEQSALLSDLRARAARQRRIDNNVQNGVYACVHDSNSFVDSWGAARSGGRSHKGVDLMAPYDVPVYAFTDGRVSRLTQGGLGGINLYLWGDDGNEYYYAHLAGYADGIHVGKRVEAGELVAYNGDTGNAAGTPHVHFELHPGGGAAINPYPYVRAAC
jgi:murein DD-endopeptidase MepM/ murein hydrolase activator NlpD